MGDVPMPAFLDPRKVQEEAQSRQSDAPRSGNRVDVTRASINEAGRVDAANAPAVPMPAPSSESADETVQELPHQSYALMELDPLIFSEEGSALTSSEFVVDLDIQYGYVLIDDKTFDLQIADGVASFTLKTENFSDTAQIELFTTRE